MDGIYTKESISINFSENEKKFSNEAVQIAKDGGKSNIKIMEASGAAFVLKEIGSAYWKLTCLRQMTTSAALPRP